MRLTDVSTSARLTNLTNDSGRYTFAGVPPGTYNITVSKAGFATYRINAQSVQVGLVLTINAKLEVGTTATTEEVVSVTGAELQTTNATVGTTLTGPPHCNCRTSAATRRRWPSSSRALPPNGAVAGAMYDQNTFQLDGGNNSNDMDGSMHDYTGSFATQRRALGRRADARRKHRGIQGRHQQPDGRLQQLRRQPDPDGDQARHQRSSTVALYEYYFATNVGAANSWNNNHTPSQRAALHPAAGHAPQPFRRRPWAARCMPETSGRQDVLLLQLRGLSATRNVGQLTSAPCPPHLMRAGVIQLPKRRRRTSRTT